MGHYITRRLGQSVFVVLTLVVLVFVLARLTGDPAVLYMPLEAPEEMREQFRIKHGLDQPILVQLTDFGGDVLRLDFGMSLWMQRPAMDVVLSRLPQTLRLAAVTTLIALAMAFLLGVWAALHPLGFADRFATFISLIGVSVPGFWLGLILILVIAVELDWLPTSGTGGIEYLILPMITLAWGPTGNLVQVVRTAVLEQLSSPYVSMARAKGLREHAVLFRHVGRNALLPVLTVAGEIFIGIANGAVIVESVFGWPGIGKLTLDAIQHRDFAVLQAIVFVVAVIVVSLNLLLDLSYAVIDPRIKYE